MIFIYLISGLFLGWSFGAKDTANVFGAAVETKMLSFKRAALISAIFVTLGALLDGSGPSQTLSRLGAVDALGGAFTVALAAAIAITIMVKLGIPVATSQTLAGAIIGWNYFAGRLTDYRSLVTIASSWIVAPVMGAVFAALLFFAFRSYLGRAKIHLLEQDTWTRYGLIVVGAFGAYALGANNIANVVGVFVPVNPFKDVMIPGVGVISGVTQLYFLGSMSIVLGIYTYSQRVMKTVGKELFRLSPITALVAVLAESLVLFLFSSKGLHTLCIKAGLPAIPLVPVSASQIIVGSILGIGLAKGGKNLKFTILGRISIGWVVAPLLAFFFSFVTLFIVQNVFEQLVHLPAKYVFNQSTLMQMRKEGVDIDRLYMVNGRTYEQERVLYLTLKNEAGMSRQTSFNIIRTAEVSRIKVSLDLVKLRRVENQLTELQLRDLSRLDKKTYNHQWELKNALQKLDSWELIKTPITPLDREKNRQMASKMDMLCRLFSIK